MSDTDRYREALRRMHNIHVRDRFRLRVEEKGDFYVTMWRDKHYKIEASQLNEQICFYKHVDKEEAMMQALMSEQGRMIADHPEFK